MATKLSQEIQQEEPQLPNPAMPQRMLRSRGPAGGVVHSALDNSVPTSLSTKNIVKNYARAICNFVVSQLAFPYLEDLVVKESENVTVQEFIEFVEERKGTIDSIKRFQKLLLITNEDEEKVRSFKRLFQAISKVFIKDFSINWIFDGKLKYKREHIFFRFRMLRRIERPEMFTYLKPFGKKDSEDLL
jgi:hypothetical protein